MGIGSNVEKRKQSAKIALAVAVANDSRASRVQEARNKIQALQACINVERARNDVPHLRTGGAGISSSASMVESLPDGWYKISNVKYKGALACTDSEVVASEKDRDQGIREVVVSAKDSDYCWYLRQDPPGFFELQSGKHASGSLYCSNERAFDRSTDVSVHYVTTGATNHDCALWIISKCGPHYRLANAIHKNGALFAGKIQAIGSLARQL